MTIFVCPDQDYEPAVQAGAGQEPCHRPQNIPQLDGIMSDLSIISRLQLDQHSRLEKEGEEERRRDREMDLKSIELMIM